MSWQSDEYWFVDKLLLAEKVDYHRDTIGWLLLFVNAFFLVRLFIHVRALRQGFPAVVSYSNH